MKLKLFTTSLFILFLFVGVLGHAQTTSTYYKDKYLSKQVSEKQAKYVQRSISNADGTVTNETVELKSGNVIRSESYKGTEAVGIWVYNDGKFKSTHNYDFELTYAEVDTNCNAPLKAKGITQAGVDDSAMGYVSPPLKSGDFILKYIAETVDYPVRAKENGIQGVVYLNYTVTENGEVENVFVVRGADPILDKEACRVVRSLEFAGPATIQGKPIKTCHTMPLRFQLN